MDEKPSCEVKNLIKKDHFSQPSIANNIAKNNKRSRQASIYIKGESDPSCIFKKKWSNLTYSPASSIILFEIFLINIGS